MDLLQEINEAIQNGKAPRVKEFTQKAIDDGFDLSKIINEAMIPAMNEIGRKFRIGEVYVPEMLIAARAMQGGLGIIKPLLLANGVKLGTKVMLGTVKGDLHDIGKNLVAMMMEGAGFEVINLGVDVGTEKYVASVQEHKPQVLCMSALLTTTLPGMKEVINALEAAGCRNDVKVLVGGAPVTQKFADSIGADGYGADATTAVELVRTLLGLVS